MVEVLEVDGCEVPDRNWFAFIPKTRQLFALWGRLKLPVYDAEAWEKSGLQQMKDNMKTYYLNHPEVRRRSSNFSCSQQSVQAGFSGRM